MKDMLHADILRAIGRQFLEIRKPCSQPVSVKKIGIKSGILHAIV